MEASRAGRRETVTQEAALSDIGKYLGLLSRYGSAIEKILLALAALSHAGAGESGELPPLKTDLPGGREIELDIAYKVLK